MSILVLERNTGEERRDVKLADEISDWEISEYAKRANAIHWQAANMCRPIVCRALLIGRIINRFYTINARQWSFISRMSRMKIYRSLAEAYIRYIESFDAIYDHVGPELGYDRDTRGSNSIWLISVASSTRMFFLSRNYWVLVCNRIRLMTLRPFLWLHKVITYAAGNRAAAMVT